MNKTTALRGAGLAVLASLSTLALPASPASATSKKIAVTGLVSVSTTGTTGNTTTTQSDLSGLGRFVAIATPSSNLVDGDTNGESDVFVRNTLSETTTRVSVSTAGAQANGPSDQPSISYDGRWVAFRSMATNLVAGDVNGKADIFLRDLRNKTTVRVSKENNALVGKQYGDASHPQVSYDGNEVLFESEASNLVAEDKNAKPDVFVRNVGAGTTDWISLTSAEFSLAAGATGPRFSGTGRYVVFTSTTNQIGIDTNGVADVFLRDRVNGTTEKVSTASDGDPTDGTSITPDVSDNGRYVTFGSASTGLTPTVDAAGYDVFRRDRTVGTTVLVTRTGAGLPANTGGTATQVSADGNKVAFSTTSTNFAGDTNGVQDAYVRDIAAGTSTRTSIKTFGGQLSAQSIVPKISPDGSASSFATMASSELYDHDANSTYDIYVRSFNEVGPFNDTLDLLQRNALDFTGKNLTTPQVVGLNNKILYGVASPESTIDDFAHGQWDDARGPVMRLYWSFFHRMPDIGGLNYWVHKYEGGKTLKSIANEFAKSSEFKTKYGSVSNDAFITLVYQNVLERNPDSAGHAHWVDRLGQGVTRGEMMTAFSESSEGVRKMRGEIDTVLLYLGMLQKLPNKAEFDGSVALLELNGGNDTEVLIFNMLTSTTYAEATAN